MSEYLIPLVRSRQGLGETRGGAPRAVWRGAQGRWCFTERLRISWGLPVRDGGGAFRTVPAKAPKKKAVEGEGFIEAGRGGGGGCSGGRGLVRSL